MYDTPGVFNNFPKFYYTLFDLYYTHHREQEKGVVFDFFIMCIVCVCVYIYIYIYRERERERESCLR